MNDIFEYRERATEELSHYSLEVRELIELANSFWVAFTSLADSNKFMDSVLNHYEFKDFMVRAEFEDKLIQEILDKAINLKTENDFGNEVEI